MWHGVIAKKIEPLEFHVFTKNIFIYILHIEKTVRYRVIANTTCISRKCLFMPRLWSAYYFVARRMQTSGLWCQIISAAFIDRQLDPKGHSERVVGNNSTSASKRLFVKSTQYERGDERPIWSRESAAIWTQRSSQSSVGGNWERHFKGFRTH